MSSILELTGKIAREFDPERIILFGSYAYGTPKDYSDVDLLVIMPFKGNSFDQATTILERVHPGYYVDVIVRSPDDAERRYRQFDPLIRDAFDRGRVLYDRTT
ncbi:MAG: nucleotidyltransferase domain-containing protein [Planctomycetota bacterium]